jgi:hypothetical protein
VDSLSKELGDEFNVRYVLWRFDILGLPGPREAAAAEAARASLVVVAASADTDLPAPAAAWLQDWAERSVPGHAALVGLLRSHRPGAQGQSPVWRFLQATAQNAGQDFFAHEFNRPAATTVARRPDNPPRIETNRFGREPF